MEPPGSKKQQKTKQISSSQPRGNFIKKQRVQAPANDGSDIAMNMRGSSQQLPANAESMQQMSSNLNSSMAAMMNTRIQQPSPSVLANQLNQNNSIDDILAQ
jgi:hypothetical protein